MRKKLRAITIAIDIIMSMICLGIELFFLYNIFNLKHISISNENMLAVITATIIVFVIPWILLIFSFVQGFCRASSIKEQIIGLISGVTTIPYTIIMILFGFFITLGGLESHTQNLNDYYKFDYQVNRQIKESNFVFPKIIPKNVYNEKYHYKYVRTLDDKVQIYASWTFEGKKEYENEKQRILNEFNIIDTKINGNMVHCYTSLSDQFINLFVYNDVTKEVHYLHLSFYESQEMQNFETLIDQYIIE